MEKVQLYANSACFSRKKKPPLLSPDRSEIEEEMDRASQIKAIVSAFPRPLLIVMRYLFAFLNQ